MNWHPKPRKASVPLKIRDAHSQKLALPPREMLLAPILQDLNSLDQSRARSDKVDKTGKVTISRAGKIHHIGIGRAHAGAQVTILSPWTRVTVLNPTTGEHLSEHLIDTNENYQRNEMNPRKL